MLKRVVSIGIGLSMLLSMSAFAEITSSTTTTYNKTTKDISVSTTIDGANEGDKITYLVHKKSAALASLADTDIVYIDQKTAGSGGSVTPFSYKTASTNIGSTILVGGSAIDAPKTGVTVPGYVNVSGSDGTVLAIGTITTDSTTVDSQSLVKVVLDSSLNISKISTINDNDATDSLCFVGDANVLWLDKSLLATDSATNIVVELNTASILNILGLNATKYGNDNVDAVSAFGQVVGSPDEYGIVFSTSEIKDDAEVTALGTDTDLSNGAVVAFPSLGKNGEGKFVVQLVDSSLSGKTLHARVYTKTGDTYTFSSSNRSIID